MKHLIIILATYLFITYSAAANNQIGDPPTNTNHDQSTATEPIRAKKKIAVTVTTGFNHLAGAGLMGKYYVTPKIGIDIATGVGVKGTKVGVQTRYMLSEKKLAPFIGLGFSQKLSSGVSRHNQSLYGNSSDIVEIDYANTSYGLVVAGWEFISSTGFVFGLSTGYSLALTDPYRIESGSLDDFTRNILNLSQGSGFIFEMNMGYAF
ncbi:hypothetical protein N9B82_00880 [Saprospiraceae bacterium]|nr:hypothetical protein [Saprospiraceae bacterium]